MKLLIVDDNSKIREMLKDMFSENFTEIRECQDGIESLDAYKEFLPDWVFIILKNNSIFLLIPKSARGIPLIKR